VLLVLDDTEGISESDQKIIEILPNRNVIVLINKTDVEENLIQNEDVIGLIGNAPIIRISVKEGTGMDRLEAEISNLVYTGKVRLDESLIVTNARHIQLLKKSPREFKRGTFLPSGGDPLGHGQY
jgi:tRNA modification GTPase